MVTTAVVVDVSKLARRKCGAPGCRKVVSGMKVTCSGRCRNALSRSRKKFGTQAAHVEVAGLDANARRVMEKLPALLRTALKDAILKGEKQNENTRF
jgi:hypothetical protein